MPTADDTTFEEMLEYDRFLELIRDGIPEINAALEVGWTPRRLKQLLNDPEFTELVGYARDEADGTIEKVLYEQASKGKQWAVSLWLFNRQPDRWKDIRRIEVNTTTTVNIGTVRSVKEAALELLREQGIEGMQALPAVIDVESHELD